MSLVSGVSSVPPADEKIMRDFVRSDDVKVEWFTDATRAAAMASLFVENVSPEYISFGELQDGRASGAREWSSDLRAQVTAEVIKAAQNTSISSGKKALCALRAGELVGVAFVDLVTQKLPRYAVLEDIVIREDERGAGVGTTVVSWVIDEAKRAGASAIYLESGIENHAAHIFFERHDFHSIAVVMRKDL